MPYQQLKSAWRIIRGFSVRHRTIVCCLSGGRWWCGPVWEPELHQSLCLLQWNHGKNQLLYFVWSPPYLLAFLSGCWGPAVHTELGRSQVEVQRCTLSWEVGKELGEESWQRAWRRVGKAGSAGGSWCRHGRGETGGGGEEEDEEDS